MFSFKDMSLVYAAITIEYWFFFFVWIESVRKGSSYAAVIFSCVCCLSFYLLSWLTQKGKVVTNVYISVILALFYAIFI